MDPNQIQLYIKVGEEVVVLGKAAYDRVRALFTGDATDEADDEALAKLDALYAARIAQAQKDAQ